jgi:hypothetical protein
MPTCPHCSIETTGHTSRNTFNLEPWTNCPGCGGAFTVDPATRRRQIIAIFIALVALGITLGLYVDGTDWLPAALLSYAALAGWIYFGNQKVRFIPYDEAVGSDESA